MAEDLRAGSERGETRAQPGRLTTTEAVQRVLLEDYQTVSKIWDRHGYYYCLTGGSVLGAIRHGGFIPWDDDFDVGLPRRAYRDFVTRTHLEMPDYLQLFLRRKTRQYLVLDTRYEIGLSEGDMDSLYDGVLDVAHPALDLQIFDGTPNGVVARRLFCLRVMAMRAFVKMAEPDRIHRAPWRPRWENVLITVARRLPTRSPESVERLSDRLEDLMGSYSFEESEYIADFIGKYHLRDVYPKSWWFPSEMVDFEGFKVPVPNGWDEYLTQIYGDYMTIPKEGERVRHIAEEREKG